ncbi:MAG TPA: inositol monophosphatase family protein, partial [Acidimicrobiia bacterium]|nr:inositol monophosphatase family protein [Acidimicrobiia bacterium]
MSDHDDAARYAEQAGRLLLRLRAEGMDDGSAPWALGDIGDVLANRLLLELLATEHPDDRVLSEESVDDPRRLDANRVWIIDPLDGTREFTEPGRVDWAVHVALWERDRGLTAGAVALPAQDRVLST